MTYDTLEKSTQQGEPVELHRFEVRDGDEVWRFTTSEYDADYGGYTYKAEPGMVRGELEHRGIFGTDELEIECLPDNKFVRRFLYVPPEGMVDYTLFRGHDTFFVQEWTGPVLSVVPLTRHDRAKIVIGTMAHELDRQVNYMKFQRQCVARLFSGFCGKLTSGFLQTGTIDSVSGNTIVSSTFNLITGDDWWTGGEFTANGYTRKVLSHVTDTIEIIYPIPDLVAGMPFSILPGCQHNPAHCQGKFAHYKYYKGQPFIPDDEPFTQRIL